MGTESDAIKKQIDDLKTKYEANTHALEQDQHARLIKLENDIALQELTFDQACRATINKLQAEIDKAPEDKKEALRLKLNKLKDSQRACQTG